MEKSKGPSGERAAGSRRCTGGNGPQVSPWQLSLGFKCAYSFEFCFILSDPESHINKIYVPKKKKNRTGLDAKNAPASIFTLLTELYASRPARAGGCALGANSYIKRSCWQTGMSSSPRRSNVTAVTMSKSTDQRSQSNTSTLITASLTAARAGGDLITHSTLLSFPLLSLFTGWGYFSYFIFLVV